MRQERKKIQYRYFIELVAAVGNWGSEEICRKHLKIIF